MVIAVPWSLTLNNFKGRKRLQCFRQPGIGEEGALGQWGFLKKGCEEEIVGIDENKL